MKKIKALSVNDIALVAVFTAVISVCGFITVPFAVPFTMQVFGVFFAIGVLGIKRSVACVLTYLILGAVGAPVFSGLQGGLHILVGQNGGFLIGFLLSAVVTGILLKKHKDGFFSMLLSMLCGLMALYFFAVIWLVFVYNFDFIAAFSLIVIFSVFDSIKIALAAYLSLKLRRFLR